MRKPVKYYKNQAYFDGDIIFDYMENIILSKRRSPLEGRDPIEDFLQYVRKKNPEQIELIKRLDSSLVRMKQGDNHCYMQMLSSIVSTMEEGLDIMNDCDEQIANKK